MQRRRVDQPKKSKKPLIVVLVCIIAAAVTLIVLNATGVIGQKGILFAVDDKAVTGDMSNLSYDDVQRQLQEAVDKSMFSFKINSRPVFENGSAEGDLMIGNPATNAYPMKVEITLDNGKKAYASEGIMPGQSIPRDSLDVTLAAGEYPATAMIYAYDPDTKELIGQTAADITIMVEK